MTADAPADEVSVINKVFAVAWDIARTPSTGRTLKRQSSQITEAVDDGFWQHVKLLADTCRTDDDWQRLLGVLHQISLDPRLDKRPIYQWSCGHGAGRGLRGVVRRRRTVGAKGAGGEAGGVVTGTAALSRRYTLQGDRAAKRKRLRSLLDGAAEEKKGEMADLSRWLLDDSERTDRLVSDERSTISA